MPVVRIWEVELKDIRLRHSFWSHQKNHVEASVARTVQVRAPNASEAARKAKRQCGESRYCFMVTSVELVAEVR